jgi:hypothetical protein
VKATVQVILRTSPELMERVDSSKNGISRNAWLIQAIEEKLAGEAEAAAAALAMPEPGERIGDGVHVGFRHEPGVAIRVPEDPATLALNANGHPFSCGCVECVPAEEEEA